MPCRRGISRSTVTPCAGGVRGPSACSSSKTIRRRWNVSERDIEFDRKGIYFLVLFDALDRCADEWQDMYRTIRGLLQVALEMRSYRRLRVKVFLRSDQMDRTRIADFPDASKILSSAAEPNWLRHDLDGLVWHCLVNGEHGETFRQQLGLGMQSSARIGPQRPKPTTTLPPRPSRFDEAHQRERFHEITGPWMGRGPRRGFPYTWIPNHLADTNGKVGPRSLLAALRTAAADTEDRHSGHDYALHYESIKRGVQRASEIRVGEVQEDYPWMHRVLQSLGGMTVPCEFEEIEKRWHDAQTLDAF